MANPESKVRDYESRNDDLFYICVQVMDSDSISVVVLIPTFLRKSTGLLGLYIGRRKSRKKENERE